MGDDLIIEFINSGRLVVDAINGLVYSTKSNTPNKPVGSKTKKGYLRAGIGIRGGSQVRFMVHRIVWVSVHGKCPGYEIDHKNRIKTDNRIENLEAVSGQENMKRAKEAGAFLHVGRRDGIRDKKGRFGFK